MGSLFAWLAGYMVSLWVCGVINLVTGEIPILDTFIISIALGAGFCLIYWAIKAKE